MILQVFDNLKKTCFADQNAEMENKTKTKQDFFPANEKQKIHWETKQTLKTI